jgi:hypothetical protein
VYKYLATTEPADDTSGEITRFVNTLVEIQAGGTTMINAATAGENFLITCAANEYDGISAQLKGEQIKFSSDRTIYFGCQVELNDADQTDLLIGLAETKTDLLNTSGSHAVKAASVGAWFVSLDESATLDFNTQTGGAITNTASAAVNLADATKMYLEMYWDGSTLYAYQNGTLVTSYTAGLPTGDLTLSIDFRTGEAIANTCKISNLRLIQIQNV